jgi:hypothetical protein
MKSTGLPVATFSFDPYYPVVHVQQRRGVDSPSRSRTLLQRKGGHRPALHSHAQPTEKRRRPAVTVTHTPARKGRHRPAQVQPCIIQKGEGISPHYGDARPTEKRRRLAVAVAHLLQGKEGVNLHKCSHAQSNRRKISAHSMWSCAANKEKRHRPAVAVARTRDSQVRCERK